VTCSVPVSPGGASLNVGLDLMGKDSTGAWPADVRAQFDTNLRQIRQLVWSPEQTLTLTRRQFLTTGQEDHTCAAICVDGVGPTLEKGNIWWGRMTLQFKMMDALLVPVDDDDYRSRDSDRCW